MDSRMDIFGILGLEHGEAHVIRNAGGVITDDVDPFAVRVAAPARHPEIILLHHTDCGLQKVTDDAFKAELEAELGVKPGWSVESFVDPVRRRPPVDPAAPAVAVHRPQGPHPRVRVRRVDRPARRSGS